MTSGYSCYCVVDKVSNHQTVTVLCEKNFLTHAEMFVVGFFDKNRTISHSKGSHGVPGIFVKYDLSSLRVHIRESHQPFWQFIVRLCGIVGGIFATSGELL